VASIINSFHYRSFWRIISCFKSPSALILPRKSLMSPACTRHTKHKIFTNDELGYIAFVAWFLLLCGEVNPLICMEVTGAYSLPLADFLVNQGYAVSMVNPAKIHALAKSELNRAKTDAKLIARYALMMQPPLWTPPPANIRALQALVRRAEAPFREDTNGD
jgi:transposase